MDPRHRADELLSRARSRGAFVVTPDNATSPMDAASTVRISREVVAGLGGEDRNSTVMLRRPEPQQQGAQQQGSPQQGAQQQGSQQHGQQGYQQQAQHAPPHQPGPHSGQQGPAPQGPPQQSGPAPAQAQSNQSQPNQGQSHQGQSNQGRQNQPPSAPAQPQRDTGPVDTTAWPTEDPQKPMTQFHFPQEFPR